MIDVRIESVRVEEGEIGGRREWVGERVGIVRIGVRSEWNRSIGRSQRCSLVRWNVAHWFSLVGSVSCRPRVGLSRLSGLFVRWIPRSLA